MDMIEVSMIDVSWTTPPAAREALACPPVAVAPDALHVDALDDDVLEDDVLGKAGIVPGWSRGLPAGTVARIRDYMLAHIGESISLEALARVACMSRFHFARRFRQSTGCSPMAFLLRMRIQRARCLLEEGECKIADIAAELGFFDQSHFTRTFRRTIGMSPRAYARSCT